MVVGNGCRGEGRRRRRRRRVLGLGEISVLLT
jgi:hypothetical protein